MTWVAATITLARRPDGSLAGVMTYDGVTVDIRNWTRAADGLVRCEMEWRSDGWVEGKRSQSVLCGAFNPFFLRKLLLFRAPLPALYLGINCAAQEVGTVLASVENCVQPRERPVRESRRHLLKVPLLPTHAGRAT